MIEAAIRREKGIDDLVSGYAPGKVDEEKPVETVGEKKFAALLEKYEAFFGRYDEYQKVNDKSKWIQNCIHGSSTITDILTPNEINQFLQTTVKYENRDRYSELTGIFITGLIQKSYNAGNNDFQLDTRIIQELHWLGAFLKGREERKIHISITGDVGGLCGFLAKNSTYNITGNVGKGCGKNATNSTYNITGNVGFSCGAEAENSTYNITGNVGKECGMFTNNSTYNITGNVGNKSGWFAKNSTFKTHNKNTLKKLFREVYGNRIIYVDNGKETVYGNYSPTRILYNLGWIK